MKKILFLFVLGLPLFCQAQVHCGKWRWSVKTLTDADGQELINQQPTQTTIDQILTDIAPKHLSTGSSADGLLPRYDSEKQLVRFTAKILEVKHEADQDYHLVLADPNSNNEMVGEIPSPECPTFNGFPELQSRFQTLRNWVDNNIRGSNGDGDPSITVQIEGIKFWDEPGHATGSPENGREIHPITDIITANGSVIGNPVAHNVDNSDNSLLTNDSPKGSGGIAPSTNPHESKTCIAIPNTLGGLLELMILAALLGMAGQVIRLLVGLKKTTQEAPLNADGTKKTTIDLIDNRQLALGLFIAAIIGSVAGLLAAVNILGVECLDKSSIIAFIAAGYAGTDLIEGFVISK